MILLEGTKITKDFGGLKALENVDLQVSEHEILGIIGPNGSGKTTLFNVISGSYPLTDGSIRFKGKVISGKEPYEICKDGIARTYQLVRPFLNLTVLENVMVGIYFGRTNTASGEGNDNAMEILSQLNLEKKHNWFAKDLTMAEKKRLEIGRAVATNPQLILLDEVMSGLTPKEIEQMVTHIRTIFDKGITILLIEHVMKAVAALSHRVMVLNYGKKICEGTPSEVANNEEVVKAYLGKKRSME